VSAVAVRAAAAGDIAAVADLDRSCSPVFADGSRYAALAAGDGWLWVASVRGVLVGFAAWQRLVDTAELVNLAVAPPHRRQGVARALLEACLRDLPVAGAVRLCLDVRAGNGAALALYRAMGFIEDGRRRGYYRGHGPLPAEDAVLMSRGVETL